MGFALDLVPGVIQRVTKTWGISNYAINIIFFVGGGGLW